MNRILFTVVFMIYLKPESQYLTSPRQNQACGRCRQLDFRRTQY